MISKGYTLKNMVLRYIVLERDKLTKNQKELDIEIYIRVLYLTMYRCTDEILLLSNNINRLTKKTTSDPFTALKDVLNTIIFYILCHRFPYPLDMVCRVWLEMFLGVRASEVSDVVDRRKATTALRLLRRTQA